MPCRRSQLAVWKQDHVRSYPCASESAARSAERMVELAPDPGGRPVEWLTSAHPRAAPDLRPAFGDEPLEATYVLIEHSGADAAPAADLPAPHVEDAKRVGGIAGDRGDPAERRSQCESRQLARGSSDDPAVARCEDVAPIFAGRPPVERGSGVEILRRDEATNGGIHRGGRS